MALEKFFIVVFLVGAVSIAGYRFLKFRKVHSQSPQSAVISLEKAQRVIARLHILRKSVLRRSEQALFRARQNHAAGRTRHLDVLEAQRTVNAARRQYIKALAYKESAISVISSSFGVYPGLSSKR